LHAAYRGADKRRLEQLGTSLDLRQMQRLPVHHTAKYRPRHKQGRRKRVSLPFDSLVGGKFSSRSVRTPACHQVYAVSVNIEVT